MQLCCHECNFAVGGINDILCVTVNRLFVASLDALTRAAKERTVSSRKSSRPSEQRELQERSAKYGDSSKTFKCRCHNDQHN
eukprot:2206481-Amphidinium_carterae.1